MLVAAVLLFVVLSPGLLLTLPPVGNKIFMSGKTSLMAIVVHAVVFAGLLYNLQSIPYLNRLEPYEDYTKGEMAGIVIGSIVGAGIIGFILGLALKDCRGLASVSPA